MAARPLPAFSDGELTDRSGTKNAQPGVMGAHTLLICLLVLCSCAYGVGPPADLPDAGGPSSTPPPPGARNDSDAAAPMVSVAFGGPECVDIRCPASAPFVVGCAEVILSGDSELGCVATLD